jgi:hypothetical protein
MKTSGISCIYLLILIAPSVLVGDEVCNLHLGAENGSTNGNMIKSIVQLHKNEHISWSYQTKDRFTMQVRNIMYINQGRQTVLSVYSDDNIIIYFGTISNNSQPMNTGQLGKDVVLPIGNHSIKVLVIHTDEYGIDIDTVTVLFVANVERDSCPTVDIDSNNNNNKVDTKDIIIYVCTPIATLVGIGILIVSIVAVSFKIKKTSYEKI